MVDGKIEKSYDLGPASGGQAKQLVVLLHGVGSNGQDLIGLAPHWAQDLPDAVFVSPDAPFVCDMVPAGYPNSYQWFSLQDRDPHVMLQGVESVAPIVEAFFEDVMKKYDVAPENTALVGFSQGTMTSLYVAPRLSHKIAGVLGFSGALIGAEGLSDAEMHKPPVCLIHGQADDVVPVSAYEAARGQLIGAGFTVSGHSTPGLTHSIDEAGIEAGSAFLKDVLGV